MNRESLAGTRCSERVATAMMPAPGVKGRPGEGGDNRGRPPPSSSAEGSGGGNGAAAAGEGKN